MHHRTLHHPLKAHGRCGFHLIRPFEYRHVFGHELLQIRFEQRHIHAHRLQRIGRRRIVQ